MREIKFKAWSIKDGTMYRVVLIDFNEQMIADEDEYFWDFDEVELIQYTGLKDMKGKEIYEGDILIDCDGYLSKVVYCDGCFETAYKFQSYSLCDPRINFLEIKIIGNIYENPELLEVKQ